LLRRLAAVQTVMEIQFHQKRRHNGHCDPRRIQGDYYHVTTPSRTQALDRAALDAREVLDADSQPQQLPTTTSSSSSSMPMVGIGCVPGINSKSSLPSRRTTVANSDMVAIKNEFDRLMVLNAGPAHPTLRSATSGPLRLRKTVPNTA